MKMIVVVSTVKKNAPQGYTPGQWRFRLNDASKALVEEKMEAEPRTMFASVSAGTIYTLECARVDMRQEPMCTIATLVFTPPDVINTGEEYDAPGEFNITYAN